MGPQTRWGYGIGVASLIAGLAFWTPAAGAQGCETPEAQVHVTAAEAHMASGRYRDAVSEFNRAILAAPECDRAKQGVIAGNRALLERRGGPDSPQVGISRHLQLGSAAFEARDYARAIAEWEAALALDPDNRIAHALIASAREAQVDQYIEDGSRAFAQGDTSAALAAWERAQELDPANRTVADLLREGEFATELADEARLVEGLENTMRRIRSQMERDRMLPYEEMGGDGLRLRDASERPTVETADAERSRAIMAELRSPVSLDFEETDLRAVLRFLSEVTGINILVDEDVFEELGEIDPDDEEAEPQIKVTIFVNELPLESALKGMLRQHGLDFQIQRDFLYISTPDVLRASSFEQLEVRYYHLRDTARIALPKLGAQPGTIQQAVGEAETTQVSGGELVQRLRRVDAVRVQDSPDSATNFSVARMLAIIRNFVPAVVETQTGAQRQAQASRAADTIVGGWSRVSATAGNLNDLESGTTRERAWDSAGREILSRIDYDLATHMLVARNTPSNLDLLEEILSQLDKPTKQVLIESRFMQVDMDDIHRVNTDLSILGLNSFMGSVFGMSGIVGASLGAPGTSLGAFATPLFPGDTSNGLDVGGLFVDTLFGDPNAGKELRISFSNDDGVGVQTAVDLLTQLDNTELVSAPRITTLSGKPAVIQDVRTQTFATDVDVTTQVVQPPPGSSAAPTIVPELDFTFSAIVTGVTLTVTPLVLDDNTIRLVLLPDVSQIGDNQEFLVPFVLFTQTGSTTETVTVTLVEVFRQSLFTNVTVQDGETLVLGGLVNHSSQYQERSVPVLRDLPWIGNFFRSTGEFVRRSQLLIFIKCNIISPQGLSYARLK